ncbi:MAG: hypothetical protein MRZ79_11280 [Bacteroidia bacterium]|nr:hypothetical protein [Bacteroidia bacterium]
MKLKYLVLLILASTSFSCIKHKDALKEKHPEESQFLLRKIHFQSEGCKLEEEGVCIEIESCYPEMLFGPVDLQKRVNREIDRTLGKMLLQTFPYLSSQTPSFQIEELVNLYNYKNNLEGDTVLSQKVGLYGSWKEQETDYWVFKLEVWVKNDGEAPLVQQRLISLDKSNARIIASRQI